ncbi:hypothetical protein FJY63_05930, partial [Candidatus Sumerlaeota bacterium]|nr:hypothetical protein [Candidatus Sumerlaeota bacterium]
MAKIRTEKARQKALKQYGVGTVRACIDDPYDASALLAQSFDLAMELRLRTRRSARTGKMMHTIAVIAKPASGRRAVAILKVP